MSQDQVERINNNFTFHPVKGDQGERYTNMREKCRLLALDIISFSPISREQSIALTHLEEVVYWTNAAIARNE